MTNEKFEMIVEDVIAGIKRVLQNKAREYASKEDRLHNFIVAGNFIEETKEKALFGMALKHIVSVRDIVLKWERARVLPSENILEEKIGDTINYMILLKACFLERIHEQQERLKRHKLQEEINEEKERS